MTKPTTYYCAERLSEVRTPLQCVVSAPAAIGGEAAVFFSGDGFWALKIFHSRLSSSHVERYRSISKSMNLLEEGFQNSLCRPLALVRDQGGSLRGHLMQRIPSQFSRLSQSIQNQQAAVRSFQKGVSYRQFVCAAFRIAQLATVIETTSFYNPDFSGNNILWDEKSGEIRLIEVEGFANEGSVPSINGTQGYRPPENYAGVSLDRLGSYHALAILLGQILLFRNLLTPLREYANDPNLSDDLGWGREARFSEHPQDKRNRPLACGLPLKERGVLSYQSLTRVIQSLFDNAFIASLHSNRERRPRPADWAAALSAGLASLITCTICRQPYFYPHWQSQRSRRCPFCGSTCKEEPLLAQLYHHVNEGRDIFKLSPHTLVLTSGFQLWSSLLNGTMMVPTLLGEVEQDQSGTHHLVNHTQHTWLLPDKSHFVFWKRRVAPGQSVSLLPGNRIFIEAHHSLLQVVAP